MLRVSVIALATVLFVGCATSTEQKQANATSPTATVAPTTPPATPIASPSPTAPTTANVKNVGIKWEDEASGTPITTIKVGGTVTWTVTAPPPFHSLKRVAGTPENGCQDLDGTFDTPGNIGSPVTRKFDKVGTFGYRCGVHGGTPNCKAPPGSGPMPGVIKVVP